MRRAAQVLSAVLPACPARGTPAAGDADLDGFLVAFHAAAPPLLRLGFAVAVAVLTWLPVVHTGRPLHRLDPDRRDACLTAYARSRWWSLRQLVLVAKLVACFAVFRTAAARRTFAGVRA